MLYPFRTLLLLALPTLLMIAMGGLIGGTAGMPLACFMAVALNIFSFRCPTRPHARCTLRGKRPAYAPLQKQRYNDQ